MSMALMQPEQQELSDAWSREEDESARAFLAFTIYRDMGAKRSLSSAERIYREQQGLPIKDGKRFPTAQFAAWSSRYRWVERATAYDDHQDQVELEAMRRERTKARVRHAAQAAEALDVLSEPLRALRKRLADESRTTELSLLDDAELIKLARHIAALYPDLQKAEMNALTDSGETAGSKPKQSLRGEILRHILQTPDMRGTLEHVAFQIAQSDED